MYASSIFNYSGWVQPFWVITMHYEQEMNGESQLKRVSGLMHDPIRRRRSFLGASILLALLAPHGVVLAQDADAVKMLDVVRVLGQAEEGFNVAVTDDMIEARQASDLEDLLGHDPSITVGGGAPVAQKIYVRGLEDTLLNVTIDGATQAGYLYHHQGRVNVEPELIKNVVVKAGAGNAADGAGALGGAIHFELKDAADMLAPGETSGALVKGGFSSNNSAWKKHASAYGLLSDDFGVLVSGTHLKSTKDYKAGDGNRVPETQQLQQDFLLKLSGNLADDHYVSLSYEDYLDKGRRYSRANMGALFHPIYPNLPVDQKTERKSWIGKYGYNPNSDLVDLSATLYHNDSKIQKRGDLWAAAWPPVPPFPTTDYYGGDYHGGGVKSLGFDLRNISRLGAHQFEYGYEYRTDTAYLVNPVVVGFNDEETDIHALFLQADLRLLDDLRLSTGLRYDNYDYTDNNGLNISDSGVSPNATLSFDVTDALELSVGYARAFKGVSSPEVFFLEFPPTGGTLTSYTGPNSTAVLPGFTVGALQAEESDNVELGFKYEAGDFAASGELYQQTIKHAQYTSSTTRYSYVDEVKVKGYALRLAYYMDDLSINAGVAHSKPELNGQPLSSGDMGLGTAYGRSWTLGLEYDYSPSIVLGWDARFVERLTDVQAGQAEKAGYGVHDLFAQWQPNDQLSVGIAINNLFDKFYYDQGTFYSRDSTSDPYGLPEPGRNFRLYASYRF